MLSFSPFIGQCYKPLRKLLSSKSAAILARDRQCTTQFNKPEDWIFASPFKAGTLPWQPWRVQQRHIAPTAVRCGIGHIGWHTFRHTFRSLLDETGAPLKVQQELMRHADIRTTMNIYGKAMEESKREAHHKVVRLVLA
jgi:integrase